MKEKLYSVQTVGMLGYAQILRPKDDLKDDDKNDQYESCQYGSCSQGERRFVSIGGNTWFPDPVARDLCAALNLGRAQRLADGGQ